MKSKNPVFWFFVYAFSIIIVVFAVLPFLWTIMCSLKFDPDIYNQSFFPTNPTLNNYRDVLTDKLMMGYFLNSLQISMMSTVISTVVAVLGAYGFSRYTFPGRNSLLYAILFTRVLPRVTLLVPFFVILSKLGLNDSKPGMVLVYLIIGMPVAIWLMKGYIDSVPYEIEEAAVMDGCNPLQILIRVIVPMVAPAIAAISMYTFILSWNEFLFPRVFTFSDHVRPISVGLAYYIDDVNVKWGRLFAASVIMSIPAILVFSYAQKYIVEGMSAGAVKG